MTKKHGYTITVEWRGNTGQGTASYQSYSRDHVIQSAGKIDIPASSDPAFRGDPTRYNPEELLLASLSACHMLWYLHLCTTKKITVLSYTDNAEGSMTEDANGGGRFENATLKPEIRLSSGDDVTVAHQLHREAHAKCFIANSVNFPVICQPTIYTE